MANKLLTLDSLADRPVVVIDNHEHRLLTRLSLSPLESHRFLQLSKRADALAEKSITADLTGEEEQELESLTDRLCRIVLLAPDEVHAKLTDRQRADIIEAFMTAPLLMAAQTAPAGEPNPPNPPIGATSSPA